MILSIQIWQGPHLLAVGEYHDDSSTASGSRAAGQQGSRAASIASLLIGATVVSSCNCSDLVGRQTEVAQKKQGIFTQNSGLFYEVECEANGVPRPPNILDSNWVNHGVINDVFVSPDTGGTFPTPLEAELWSFTSTSPRGICLALPRWFTAGPDVNRAALFGVICMGQQSGKACFWDNPPGTYFNRNTSTPLALFNGGAELLGKPGGVCTDCHAGENPFVVHPNKPAFKAVLDDAILGPLLRANSGWHEPIVPLGWPANPGPTNILAGRSGSDCSSCHKLPEVSTDLPDYCNEILEKAVTRTTETMPQNTAGLNPTEFAADRLLYTPHINALRAFCKLPPSAGEIVYVGLPGNGGPLSDDVSVLSPPYVDGPLYACARILGVYGVVPDATVELFRDGLPEATATAGPFGDVTFTLSTPISAGEQFTAKQTLGSSTSDPSTAQTAITYSRPSLPRPRITTPLYACADQIGVHTQEKNVFAKVTKNQAPASLIDQPVSGTWNSFSPTPSPWTTTDTFQAETYLCGVQSPSIQASALPLPMPLRPGRFWTAPGASGPAMYDGQKYLIVEGLDNGAFASVSHFGTPIGNTNSDPEGEMFVLHLPTSPLGRNAIAGDQFSAQARFACSSASIGSVISSGTVQSCSSLPAPRIAQPREGENFVTVLQRVPGSRIRVYRANGTEIGDGAGPRVMLDPPNVFTANETIRVTQQLGTCVGVQGYSIDTLAGQ